MLERTAASLESCRLQRVLSKPARSLNRSRNLHTGFWQHGASAIELSNIWPAMNRGKEGGQILDESACHPAQTGLLTSAYFLDFLYPNGICALLRRLYPTLPHPRDIIKPFGATRRGNLTSRTAAATVDTAIDLLRCGESLGWRSSRVRKYTSRSDNKSIEDHDSLVAEADPSTPSTRLSNLTARGQSLSNQKVLLQKLADVIERPKKTFYHEVWHLYGKLDDQQNEQIRSSVVVYLSTSHSIVDVGRAISIFRQIPAQSWSDELQAAGILLCLQAGDQAAALDIFNTGLHSRSSGAGLQHLLLDALMRRHWATVLKVWLDYFSTIERPALLLLGDYVKKIPSMTANPHLAELYFAFERYLATEAAGATRAIDLYTDTKLGLEALRLWIAHQVLMQPCPPKQAKHILQIWNNAALYQEYLSYMLQRLDEGVETKTDLISLSEIYFIYRKLDGVRTPVSLLRKMFNFYYPADTAGLAEVYRDWTHGWGGLNRWGYEKFLKFYSMSGDIRAVKDLWTRYTKEFPAVVEQPLGFRSTINAFAQAGDIVGAEQEFRTMTETYGVKPDIDSWNTLLKCYSKTDDQARAFQCFEEIKKVCQPDAFTYAQVMAMAAKRGDLATVLKYFNQSQTENIPISKEMALSLVMVYCHNNQFRNAEKICVEFTQRGATSTAVWNQLVYYNGQLGNWNKCYTILESMKRHGVEWDHQTHDFLLRALVHVDQIQSAFQLLQTARADGLFPVGPEHFSVVMSGAVRIGDLVLAETIYSHMQSAGFEVPLKAQVSLVQASARRVPSAERTRALSKDLLDRLLSMLSYVTDEPSPPPGKKSSTWKAPSGLVELKSQTADIGRTIMLFVEQRDYAAIEQFVPAYLKVFPEYKGKKKTFPPEIASALMQGYMQDNKLDQVREMWKQTFDAVIHNSTSTSGVIYPALQYDLSQPLNVVIRTFGKCQDGAGLLRTIEEVLQFGFKLTRTNWNLAIRHLADLGQWERAMDWCEKMLMTRWLGWTHTSKSLQERYELKNNRIPVASKATVFSLQREWLKLRKLAAWSGDVSSKLKDIEQRHPKLHYAFITTDYEHLSATWILPKRESMTRAIKDLLKPLSHDELKAMRNALEKQLRLEKRKRHKNAQKSSNSPFHVASRPGDKKRQVVVTRAVSSDELQELNAALTERLDGAQERPV